MCGPCSSKKFLLPQQSSKAVRVCLDCFDSLSQSKTEKVSKGCWTDYGGKINTFDSQLQTKESDGTSGAETANNTADPDSSADDSDDDQDQSKDAHEVSAVSRL